MTRNEIEQQRALLKTYFPNQSSERAMFNTLCDMAVKYLKTPVPEAAPPRDIAKELIASLEGIKAMRKCKKCEYPNCFCEGGAGEERATIAVPREMFQAAMCAVNRDRWASSREGFEDGAQAMKELHDQMSDLWMASSSGPQKTPT